MFTHSPDELAPRNVVLGLQGLLQLIASRNDVPKDLRELIEENHRWQAAEMFLCVGASPGASTYQPGDIIERPAAPEYIATNAGEVLQAGQPVCKAASRNMARRISNALNAYTPNRRGV